MEGRAGTPDFLPQVTALSSRWQSQAATGGRGQKAVDPGLARSGAGWALGQDYRQWSWERVRGEMWRGSSPFCHEHAVVHSHVCHQVEWPRLPKAVHLSLIPSSHTFATITPTPWAPLRSCRCQLAGSLQGPHVPALRASSPPVTAASVPGTAHLPQPFGRGRRLTEKALPEAPKLDMAASLPAARHGPRPSSPGLRRGWEGYRYCSFLMSSSGVMKVR